MVTGIDIMLSQYIRKTLDDQLGKKVTSKIEQDLDLWYHISLDEAITQFDKLDRVLVNLYGKNPARALEKRFLKKIIGTDSKKEKTIITINDPQLIQAIFTMLEDVSLRKIFDAMDGKEMGILEILQIANLDLSEQSKYRRIDALIRTGLIMETGYAMGSGGRRVKTYKKIFERINISLNDNYDAVQINMTVDSKSVFQKSLIINTILEV